MHEKLLESVVKNVRQRIAEGDCPTTKAESVETLENAVDSLAREVERLSGQRVS